MLPGKLTIKHIEYAEQRGEKSIRYMKKTYTVEELYELAGSRRAERKPEVDLKLDGRKAKNRDGIISKQDSNIGESGPFKGLESDKSAD